MGPWTKHGGSDTAICPNSILASFARLNFLAFIFVHSILSFVFIFNEIFDAFIVSPFVLVLSVLIFPYRIRLHQIEHIDLFVSLVFFVFETTSQKYRET